MTGKDPEARREAAYRRLGSRTPKCATCGDDRWQCLEAHHVAGKDHDPTTGTLCRNCHRVQSDAQRDMPPKYALADPQLDAIGRFLLGLADMLAVVLERLRECGANLMTMAREASRTTSEHGR